ncbi:MAG: DNA mismatch endonuclease Vsr [Acidobacteria bacterium]|nr:DNA mismatch endonuclease Vsr [Acidobacteriota bacterium]
MNRQTRSTGSRRSTSRYTNQTVPTSGSSTSKGTRPRTDGPQSCSITASFLTRSIASTCGGTRRISGGPKVKKSRSRSKSSRPTTRRPEASSEHVRHRMRVTRRRDTPGELALRSALRALGLRYRVDVALTGTRRRADVVFLGARVAVFVDGCFWHGCPAHGTWPKANAAWWREKIEGNRRRDRDTDRRLKRAGWTVLRFWEHEGTAAAARAVESALRLRADRPGRRAL